MDGVVVLVFGCLLVYVKRNEKNKSSINEINEINEIGAFSLFFFQFLSQHFVCYFSLVELLRDTNWRTNDHVTTDLEENHICSQTFSVSILFSIFFSRWLLVHHN